MELHQRFQQFVDDRNAVLVNNGIQLPFNTSRIYSKVETAGGCEIFFPINSDSLIEPMKNIMQGFVESQTSWFDKMMESVDDELD